MCRVQSSTVSPIKGLFPHHLPERTICSKDLSPGRPQQWMCTAVFPRVTDKQNFQDYLQSKIILLTQSPISYTWTMNMQSIVFSSVADKWLFRTFFSVKLSYPLNIHLSLRRPEQWMSRGFRCITNDWAFQDHCLSKTLLKCFVSRETRMIYMKNLPKCHWETAFSRPYFEQNYHIASLKLCLLGDLNNACPGFLVHSFVLKITLLLSQYKYAYHIANISNKAIMLNSHRDPNLPKMQPTATATSQVIGKYVPGRNMTVKCHIFHVHIWQNYVSIHI